MGSQATGKQVTRSQATRSQATGKQEPEALLTASNAAENPAAAQGRNAWPRNPGSAAYNPKKAGYDLGKLRAKGLVERIAHTHRYRVNPAGVRVITGALCLRQIILKPVLAGLWHPDAPPEPTPAMHPLDVLTLGVQSALHKLLREAGLAPLNARPCPQQNRPTCWFNQIARKFPSSATAEAGAMAAR